MKKTNRLLVFGGALSAIAALLHVAIVISGPPWYRFFLVLAWAELHQDELMADWELVMNGEEPFKIQPLQ